MMPVRWTKVFREIWLFKARTLLVVVAIGVGVGAFGLMNAGRSILERDMQQGFDVTQPAHAVLRVAPLSDELPGQVAAMPGVAAAEGRSALAASIVGPDGIWRTLQLQAVPDWSGVTVSRLIPEPGTALDVAPGGVLLERSTAQQFGFAVGQTARLRLADGQEQTLTVAGLVRDQAITPSSINVTTAYGYVGLDTLAQLDQPRDLNQLYVRFAGASPTWSEAETSATRIVGALERSGHTVFSVTIPQPGKPQLWDTMNGVLFILVTMGALTLALSGFLIVNMMWAVIARQIPQIGVLKSIGGRRGQIVRLYLEMVLIFGLLALLIALPLALGGAYGMATGVGKTLNVTISSVSLPPVTVGTLVIASLLVPVLAALVPVLSGARMTIRDAISGQPQRTRMARWRQRVRPDASRSLLATTPTLLLISIRNTFRRAGRVALTLVALSLAGAMFVAVLGVRQALQDTVLAMQGESNYDVDVTFAQPYPVADILRAARSVADVTDAEAWGIADARRVVSAEHIGGSMVLIGVPAGSSMWVPSVTAGRRLAADERGAVFINADTYELLHDAALGQSVALRIGTTDMPWRIVGLSARGIVPLAYMSYADFERAVGREGYASRLVVRTQSSTPQAQRTAQAALLQALQSADLTATSSSTTADSKRSFAANLDVVAIMLLAMVALVALVGGLGLASTMSINVLERTREIGVLRALGAKTPAVRRIVVVEGLLIGVVSALIGIVASAPLGRWLSDQLGPRVLYHPLPFVFSWWGAALWVGIVSVIAVVASLAPAQSAARMTIRDTLAYDG